MATVSSPNADVSAAEASAHRFQAEQSPDLPPPIANNNNNNNANEDFDFNDDESIDREPLSETNLPKIMVDTALFVEKLQDDGVMNTNKSPPVMEHKDMMKLATALYNKFKNSKLIDIPKNKSRTIKTMLSVLVHLRNHMDVHEVLPELSAHLPSSSTKEKMYIIDNNASGGQERYVSNLVARFGKSKPASQRNSSLAVRVVICLCHPSVRGGVVHYLKGRKNREELDSSHSTSLALGEEILKLFESDDLVINRPDMMDLPNHDPNVAITPETCDYMGRTAEWILATWNSFIKPKYKKVLTKWYKQTGGGGRELEDFVNYCVLNHGSPVAVWLAWVYAIDHEADLILASVSAGRPPQFISGNQEAGFEGTSNADGSPSDFVTPRKRKADIIKAQLEESHARMDKLLSIVEAQAASKAESNPIHSRLRMMGDVSSARSTYEQASDFTPNTKEEFLKALASEEKSIAHEIIDISKKRKASEE